MDSDRKIALENLIRSHHFIAMGLRKQRSCKQVAAFPTPIVGSWEAIALEKTRVEGDRSDRAS